MRPHHALVLSGLMATCLLAGCANRHQETKLNRLDLITAQPFSVKMIKDGADITALAGVKTVEYRKDGTGVRTLADGKQINGTWRFVDPEQTIVETVAPTGSNQFRILELTPTAYRKVDMKSGIEIQHFPLR
jgi:hypothetical protein